MSNAVDLVTTYSFLKRLVTPFNKWKAFKLGIIDDEGNQLKQRSELKTSEEKDSFGYLDILCLNLKRLIAKLPAGKTAFASMAAALLLLKEHPTIQKEDMSLMNDLPVLFEECLEFYCPLHEDGEAAPVNTSGGGAVAGLGIGAQGEPPGPKNRKAKNKALIGSANTILKRKFP